MVLMSEVGVTLLCDCDKCRFSPDIRSNETLEVGGLSRMEAIALAVARGWTLKGEFTYAPGHQNLGPEYLIALQILTECWL